MTKELNGRDLIVAITPFEEPNARLAVAVERAGGLGVLDLGREARWARTALADARRWSRGRLGVRIPVGCPLSPADLPDEVDTVVLAPGSPWDPSAVGGNRRALVEVTSLAEARGAARAGARGLIAKGCEAGGRVGDLTTFVLLQQLMAAPELDLPVWAAGGIGLHSIAAAIAGGAVGVVLDAQLALVTEAELPPKVAAAIRAMDGSETVVIGGHRVYLRPDLPVARLAAGTDDVLAVEDHLGDVTELTGVVGESRDADPLGGTEAAFQAIALRLGARDLHAQLLPIGQDGAFARLLAERYKTAGGVVQAVRRSIESHLASAVAARPLAPASAFARTRLLRYPVAQGPMTRVSDRAAFAAAVADGGGLPFLALALMTGGEVRALLEETATLLGDRPWGVGILGFVPAEIREAQLEVVHDMRPPCALIAGGRPSQAAPLEAAGIDTFLHVPSPGLLDQFLKDGARKFVFEGRECGGHVGPRASFPLWEAQVERLLAFGTQAVSGAGEQPAPGSHGEGFFDELHVLFAGGIHDERSAAMVAALAAPLAERGTGVGVLMGTAYLFTEEAVEAGAILSGFQQAALECDRTVLLETSPGHATRCVESEYVHTFLDTKRRLQEAGVSNQEQWAELEQLNLGRLRIASKGLRRGGRRLVEVDEDEQRREGMFMIGQVAALRSSITTVNALHEQVTDGATALLVARAAELGIECAAQDGKDERSSLRVSAVREHADPLDVAIVGMACVFPQAGDLARYWANIVAGVDAVTEVPASRWDSATYYDPEAIRRDSGERTPSKWGGFIPPVPFDAFAYGIPPASLASVEPMQLLALQVAAQALADAGYADRPFDRERTSVVFGAEAGTDLGTAYSFRSLFPSYFGKLPPDLDEQLPRLTEDSFPGVLTNVIAGRIANRLNLGGPNYTVDAACAASLAALDAACKELRAQTSDIVLCGGADLHNGIYDYLLFSAVHALSPSGRCATFDSAADGIVLGEGVACVVLKRLADAERDGDRIYAVIKGVAGSSDGRSLGLTAPRTEGQRLAMERAYRMAGVSPARVELIEAHGTGTAVGDRTELATLTEVFKAAIPGGCALGSVKSQIGHTKCAAGLAGLIKTAYALYAGVRPGALHLRAPNPYWDRDSSPFFFDQAARPWATPPGQRYAGISGFGFGGANFHAVLAGYDGAPEPLAGLAEWPAELFCIRGADREAALRELDRLAELLAANDRAGRPWRLRDLARTFADGDRPVRVALVATGLDDLTGKLAAARDLRTGDGVFVAVDTAEPGRVAFLFPGQGSQRPGMLADLFIAFPRLQRLLRLAEGRYAGPMFPPAAFSRADAERQQAKITDTRVAQPALGIAGLAVFQLLSALGVRPDIAGGHSYGELVALCAAGVYDEDTLLELSQARAAAILAAAGDDPGAMAAVAGSLDEVRDALGDSPDVVVANHNAPRQAVISGSAPGVAAALVALGERGISAKRIPVACAFHSPIVAGAARTLRSELASRNLRAPMFPVWSNSTATPYPSEVADVRVTLAGQVAAPVRFVEQIEQMYAAGARVFIEAGPGHVLTQLVGKILGDRPHTAVACDAPEENGVHRLLLALAKLAVAGVSVNPAPLFAGRDAVVCSARGVPARPGWIVDGHLVRTADGQYLPNALRPAVRSMLPGGVAMGEAGQRDTAVLEYLRTTRELVAAQRDVLLGYLGTPPPPPPLLEAPQVVTAEVVKVVDAPAAPPKSGPRTPEEIRAAVLAVISARTGYPADMLETDLDLEADLSIDSIKRTEIIGELADRVGLTGAGNGVDESVVEQLARIKRIGEIVDWIADRTLSGGQEDLRVDEPADSPASPAVSAPRRYVVRAEPAPQRAESEPVGDRFVAQRFIIVDDGCGIALELAGLLEQHGAQVCTPLKPDGPTDGLIHLGALRPGSGPVLPEGYGGLRDALLSGPRWLIVATGSAGTFGHGYDADGAGDPTAGAGLCGLARTVAQEFPDVLVRAVDVDTKDAPGAVAGQLFAELLAADSPVVVGYAGGARRTLAVVPAEPPIDTPLSLSADAVVLLTGGARGITARTAIALARATGCHVELIGRTSAPDGPSDPALAAATDEVAIRQALIERGVRSPAQIEVATRRILAEREVRATLDELAGVAASVRYTAADVRDPVAVQAVVEDIYARHGRLDGVIHGAGVLEDRLLRDKTPESFARVYGTKVDGARALAAAVHPDLGFFVVFSSVSGVFGNRGQVDYAAANDAVDTLARVWRTRLRGRVLVVDWGPWAGGGMVVPDLAREYARRGIALIEPDAGVAALLRELAAGDEVQVVYLSEQA